MGDVRGGNGTWLDFPRIGTDGCPLKFESKWDAGIGNMGQ